MDNWVQAEGERNTIILADDYSYDWRTAMMMIWHHHFHLLSLTSTWAPRGPIIHRTMLHNSLFTKQPIRLHPTSYPMRCKTHHEVETLWCHHMRGGGKVTPCLTVQYNTQFLFYFTKIYSSCCIVAITVKILLWRKHRRGRKIVAFFLTSIHKI